MDEKQTSTIDNVCLSIIYHTVGYNKEEVYYQWTSGRGVNIASDMKLSQFDLISTPTGNETVFLNRGKKSIEYCTHTVQYSDS